MTSSRVKEGRSLIQVKLSDGEGVFYKTDQAANEILNVANAVNDIDSLTVENETNQNLIIELVIDGEPIHGPSNASRICLMPRGHYSWGGGMRIWLTKDHGQIEVRVFSSALDPLLTIKIWYDKYPR